MPTLQQYRSSFSVEAGPYIGPDAYEVRAMSGSDTTKLVCVNYPIQSGIPQDDSLIDRPLYRPSATLQTDRHRYVMAYNPSTGTITPDIPWTVAPLSPPGGTNYGFLEAFTYHDLEQYQYQDIEGTGVTGIGERFEVLGPFDVPTAHRLINDGLKRCWVVVEVACIPTVNTTRHDLSLVAPWLIDPGDVLQVGLLANGEDRNLQDPFTRRIRGTVERDGGTFYLNTQPHTYNAADLIYLRVLKRAYDHCRASGGVYGDQAGLVLETDEAPLVRDWVAAAALVAGWRQFGHLLEPAANQTADQGPGDRGGVVQRPGQGAPGRRHAAEAPVPSADVRTSGQGGRLMSLYAKRRPFPYHVVIDNVGFMIGAPQPGQPALVSTKSADISAVAPPDYSYAGCNPTNDREEPFQQMTLGLGLSIQQTWDDQRYMSANAVDMSVWPWMLGPEIIATTPTGVDACAASRSSLSWATCCTRPTGSTSYGKPWRSDLWTVVKTFAQPILDVCVFSSNFDGVQRAFFALASGVAQYTSNGTAYTAMATFSALAFTVIGKEFWWADDTNELRKLDTNADPTNEANYTSLIFRAGDKSSLITSLLVTSGGTLVIAKTDGLYTLNSAGDDHELFPFLRYADVASNGKTWGTFENGLYVAYGNALGRIDPDLSWTSVGPDDLSSNVAGISGRVTAFAGVDTMFAYAALLDRNTNTGYLMKFGAWVALGVKGPRQSTLVTALGSQGTGEPVHIDAWHGSVSIPFVGRGIQQLFVSNIDSPVAGHTRTYIGFSDGSIGYVLNPCTPNPAGCVDYKYFVGDGWVDLPVWHGGYHASVKSLRHFSVTGPRIDANNYVRLEYRLNPTPGMAWTAFPHQFNTSVYERALFPTGATGTLARCGYTWSTPPAPARHWSRRSAWAMR